MRIWVEDTNELVIEIEADQLEYYNRGDVRRFSSDNTVLGIKYKNEQNRYIINTAFSNLRDKEGAFYTSWTALWDAITPHFGDPEVRDEILAGTFASDAARDTFFVANPTSLLNSVTLVTVVVVNGVKQFWQGQNLPSSYTAVTDAANFITL